MGRSGPSGLSMLLLFLLKLPPMESESPAPCYYTPIPATLGFGGQLIVLPTHHTGNKLGQPATA